jgi:hypothetical protein
VLTLYFIFVRDALRLTALWAGAYILWAGALLRFGFSAPVVQMLLPQVTLVGLFFLSQRYAGRNTEWILGLSHRKTALAWYNFVLNLSLVAVAAGGVALVMFATDLLAPQRHMPVPFVLQARRLLDLQQLHGRELAFAVFLESGVLFCCWTVNRPPNTRDFAKRQRYLLLAWVAGVLGFVFEATRGEGALSRGVSPLLLFVIGTTAMGVGVTRSTAKALGASLRQRRVWMAIGGAIGLAEALLLVTISLADLRSADPAIREQAARLFGSPSSPLAP